MICRFGNRKRARIIEYAGRRIRAKAGGSTVDLQTLVETSLWTRVVIQRNRFCFGVDLLFFVLCFSCVCVCGLLFVCVVCVACVLRVLRVFVVWLCVFVVYLFVLCLLCVFVVLLYVLCGL